MQTCLGVREILSAETQAPNRHTLGVQDPKAFLHLGLLSFLAHGYFYFLFFCLGLRVPQSSLTGNAFSPQVHGGVLLDIHLFLTCPHPLPPPLRSPHCPRPVVPPPHQAGPHTSAVPQGRSVSSIPCPSHVHSKRKQEFLPGAKTLWTEKIKSSHPYTQIANI